MQFQNPDVWEMFRLLRNAYGEGKQRCGDAGAFLKKKKIFFFWWAAAAPAKKRSAEKTGGTSLMTLKWTEISCKAEEWCLERTGAELCPANELGLLHSRLSHFHQRTAVQKKKQKNKTSATSLAEKRSSPEGGHNWNMILQKEFLGICLFGGIFYLDWAHHVLWGLWRTNFMFVNTWKESAGRGWLGVRAGSIG